MHNSTTPGSISKTRTATHGVASITRILAIDLGKFKSVACDYNAATGEHTFTTVATRPQDMHDLLTERSPERLVIEVGSRAGWVKDLAEVLGIEIQVANPNHEAWRWKNSKRKTDNGIQDGKRLDGDVALRFVNTGVL